MSDAQKAEANAEPIRFRFHGEQYSISVDDITIEAMELNDREKYTLAVREIIGDEQYARFKATNRTVTDLEQFLQAMFLAVKPGNSPASSDS